MLHSRPRGGSAPAVLFSWRCPVLFIHSRFKTTFLPPFLGIHPQKWALGSSLICLVAAFDHNFGVSFNKRNHQTL